MLLAIYDGRDEAADLRLLGTLEMASLISFVSAFLLPGMV
jgi:hypothetical protein